MSIAVRLFSILRKAISAVVEPDPLVQSDPFSSTPTAVNSTNATCTVTGGVAPITYQWVRVSGSADIDINNDVGALTSFYTSFPAPGIRSAVFRCDVTDSGGATASSNSITVTLEAFSPA